MLTMTQFNGHFYLVYFNTFSVVLSNFLISGKHDVVSVNSNTLIFMHCSNSNSVFNCQIRTLTKFLRFTIAYLEFAEEALSFTFSR